MEELLQQIRDLIKQLDVMLQLLKYRDVADILGVREQTVRQWVSANKIEYVKIGSAVRFKRTYIEDFIKKYTKRAKHEI